MRGALLVVAAILLAGCAADSTPKDELDEEFNELDLGLSKTTGIIRGLVVDASLTPVPDATVVLSPGNLEATTNDVGLFGYSDVDPGTYFIKVTKTGYAATQQSTEVVAGLEDPPVVKVLLERIPGLDPYTVQQHYSAYISCSFKLANYVFDAFYCDPAGVTGMQANDDSAPVFEVDAMPDYYQSEMTWETTQALGTDLVTIQETCVFPDCGDAARICNVRGPSPLVCRVNATVGGGGGGVGLEEAGMGDGRGYRVAMFANCVGGCVAGTAVGVGVVLEQPLEIYTTMFYNYLPPVDWLFVDTSSIPPP